MAISRLEYVQQTIVRLGGTLIQLPKSGASSKVGVTPSEMQCDLKS
jgi:hypothetical protein